MTQQNILSASHVTLSCARVSFNMHLMLLLLAVVPFVSAQFGFFEQMFSGQGHHQQQRQGNPWTHQSESGQYIARIHITFSKVDSIWLFPK